MSVNCFWVELEDKCNQQHVSSCTDNQYMKGKKAEHSINLLALLNTDKFDVSLEFQSDGVTLPDV